MEQEAVKRHSTASDKFLAKIRLPVIGILSALLALGVYYFFFVQRSYTYLSGRDFRFLAAIGTQLRSSLETRGKQIQSLAQEKKLPDKLKKEKQSLIEEFARGFEDVEIIKKDSKDEPPIFILQRNGGKVLVDVCDTASKPTGGTCLQGTLKLQTIAEPLFRPRKAFDTLLLANARGDVIYRRGTQDLSITDLDSLLAKSGRSSGHEKGGTERANRLLPGSSGSYNVELNGLEYRLFVEPVRLPLQELGSSTPAGEAVWLVCGLIPRKEFVYKSLAVSSSLLSSLLGLILLAALSWPFLKLFLISKTQRVSLFDVLLLGICSLLGISVITLFLLDAVFFSRLKEISKEQLHLLTEKMESNVRSEIVAAYPVMTGLEKAIAPTANPEDDGTATSLLKRYPDLFFSNYPLAQQFTLIDQDGKQIYKGTVNSRRPFRILVKERDYFKQSLNNNTWDLNDLDDGKDRSRPRQPFYIEPVVGRTSGTPVAILAKPVDKPVDRKFESTAKVASLTIPMVSLINPVLPPGVKFAVVDNGDENGRVLFHSEPERMLNEDFLVETDQDRRLRSAIFARRAETLSTRYWGEEYTASIAPIRGLPWTIVTLQDMKVLRAVNIDWISTTLLLILLYTGAVVLALIAIALAKPSYRADWIWPDPDRHHDYRILARAYALLLGGFALALLSFRNSAQLIGLSFLLPALAVLMTYLRLRKKASGRRLISSILWLLLLLVAAFLFQGTFDQGPSGILQAPVFLLVSLSLLTANGDLSRMRRWLADPRDAAGTTPEPPPAVIAPPVWKPSVATSYCLGGVLLLLLTSVLPTTGFFKVAYNLHSTSFLRHGQLRMAMSLKQREAQARQMISRVSMEEKEKKERDWTDCLRRQRLAMGGLPATRSCPWASKAGGLDLYTNVFYGTKVALLPFNPAWHHSCEAAADREIFPELIEGLLPRYSEAAAEMRELLHSSSSDCMWFWENASEYTFQSRDYPGGIHLSSLGSPSDSASTTAGKPVAKVPVYLSSMIATFPPFYLFLLVLLCGLVSLVALLVRFVARRVFLIDLLEPLWLNAQETGPATIGRNLFLIGKDRNWKEEVKKSRFYWMHFKDLEDPEKGWPACRAELMESDRVILVEGFEYKLRDPELNRKKLLFLEEIAEMPERTVVVTSTISPARLFFRGIPRLNEADASLGSLSMIERWRNLLSMFTVYEEDLLDILRRVEDSSEIKSEALKVECGLNPHLLSIAQELDRYVEHLNREQILEELGERAEGYYQALWASCSSEEQVVLEHLAEEGLVNEKSRRVLRRLMARGFVRRGPNFRLMNETFRRFVASSNRKREVLVLESEAAPSAWDRLRAPLFVGLAASLIFFLTTQQELLDGLAASVTGLTAGLPAIVKLFDFFGSGRAGSPRLPGTK
jgi:hypothetical protein